MQARVLPNRLQCAATAAYAAVIAALRSAYRFAYPPGGLRDKGASVKYFDLSGGRLTSLM